MSTASFFLLLCCLKSAVQLQWEKLALLGIDDRTIRHQRAVTSLHFKGLRHYPAFPKTLGEHLRKKRIDLSLSMTQLAKLLGVGIANTAIEKWETNQNYPTPPNRIRIIEFLGFDPEWTNPTGDL